MRLISRFRRWLDRLRTPQQVYITPDQFRQMQACASYREKTAYMRH